MALAKMRMGSRMLMMTLDNTSSEGWDKIPRRAAIYPQTIMTKN